MTTNITGYPLAYLITFRTYGTWLHGDERGSVDRRANVYGTPRIPRRPEWDAYNAITLKHPPVTLDAAQRGVTSAAIRETCDIRSWSLIEINVRTNHVHAVVAAPVPPERVLNALKANATRSMREAGCWPHAYSPWSAGGSTRYLWSPSAVERAIAYVRDGQGGPLPDF